MTMDEFTIQEKKYLSKVLILNNCLTIISTPPRCAKRLALFHLGGVSTPGVFAGSELPAHTGSVAICK
ncbi:hypothetical protein A3F00_01320 [Candidatus Daviesbacteria bacterium RIFCSPHIGHO2_12_FULL_37_11]|uniref:Uncharacterized protein n=1 Tax=Candidatus Daviesbacteria bacterium RIFCSPHIGHO2_12_FULL_37_11 TaxID=1797777 RepID=A0A1F5KD59_9BACT|nr:MAG: hypothetical protein A3F00_01320 [Candidatus Daviesbacteria bacterium RIFCSPHIGHO2_12_FULL_37_11]OGE44822.1 MAG: hypothetical protein A3B39_00195 [Candidatus Daviesbacteria bacterium RIFCSPLOWO2_01_FULL_37_10]